MIASTVIESAQSLLQDEYVHWPKDAMFRYLNEGLLELQGERPYLLLDATGTALTAVTTITGLDDALPFANRWAGALAYYIAYRALEEDSADTQNQKQAEMYHQRFIEELR